MEINAMSKELAESLDGEGSQAGMVLLTVQQAHAFEAAVAAGKFASFEDAVNASANDLELTKVGSDLYSKAALVRLQTGIEQAERGEVIPSEEVEAWFDEWQAEINKRTDD